MTTIIASIVISSTIIGGFGLIDILARTHRITTRGH